MKNQYKIAKHTENGTSFYNEGCHFFSKQTGTIYTNKKEAQQTAKYAKRYYTSNKNDVVEVVKIS